MGIITSIWNLIPVKIKNISVICFIFVLIIVILLITIWFKNNTIDELTKEVIIYKVQLDNERIVYEYEKNKSNEIINKQNEAILQYSINKEKYEEVVKEQVDKLIEDYHIKQEQINKELEVDSSSDNQLKIINKILKDFANEAN